MGWNGMRLGARRPVGYSHSNQAGVMRRPRLRELHAAWGGKGIGKKLKR